MAVEGEATLAAARRAAVDAAVAALCAKTSAALPTLPAVQGVSLRGSEAGGVTRYADLVHRVGADAARYALVRTRAERPVRLDLAAWVRRDETNPLWRVRYVRARALLCLRTAAAYGEYPTDDHYVVTDGEAANALDGMPRVLLRAVESGEPHRIADHLERRVTAEFEPLAVSLAEAVSTYRDITRDQRRTYRDGLALAARYADAVALALPLLGVAAPDRV